MFRNIKYGIKNIIKWMPVIWNDRQWDQYYLYLMLRHKLSLMEKFFREDGITLSSEEKAEKMELCILLLDRLIKSEYIYSAYKNHDKKWGEIEMTTKELPNGNFSCHISRPNAITEKEKEQERKETLRCAEREAYLEKQDIGYLFNTIKKYILYWWD